MTTDKATKRPWKCEDGYIHPINKKISIAEIYNSSSYAPAGGYEIPSVEEGLANAKLIVKCVNMHDELINKLKEIDSIVGALCFPNAMEKRIMEICEQALKKAEE